MSMLIPDFMKKFLPGMIAVIFLFPITAMAKSSQLSVGERVKNIKTITSYAAKGQTSKEALAQVKQLLERADAALKKNDLSTADTLCTQAWDTYQAAVKAAQVHDHKAKEEKALATITASAKALLKQVEEMDKESQGKNSGQIEEVKSLLAQAAAAHDTTQARAIANQAYTTLKTVVKDLRNGKTVTFDHTFATPALKFADELAYNDMHFGLLGPALEQLGAQADAEYNAHVSNAKKLRKQAEAEAKKDEYAFGVRDLVQSTKELKEALNHIGLSVPDL